MKSILVYKLQCHNQYMYIKADSLYEAKVKYKNFLSMNGVDVNLTDIECNDLEFIYE